MTVLLDELGAGGGGNRTSGVCVVEFILLLVLGLGWLGPAWLCTHSAHSASVWTMSDETRMAMPWLCTPIQIFRHV